MTNRLGLFALLLVAGIEAQSPAVRSSFETASIKASVSGRTAHPGISMSHGALTVRDSSLQDLIRVAYGIRDFQISGGRAWINSDHYDIEAKGSPIPKESFQTMCLKLQALLEDRFKLKLHRETRQLPVYALTVGKYGFLMRPSKETSCPTFKWDRNSPPRGQDISVHCGAVVLVNDQLNQTLDADGMNLTDLTAFLSEQVDRPVTDKTSLTGLFDLHMEWNRQATAALLGGGASGDPRDRLTLDDPDSPSLFTAVQEQLGLKLESTKGPVEVLVIDHAEKPSFN